MREWEVYLILNAIREIGPVLAARIREKLGQDFSSLFELDERDLQGVKGVGPATIHSIRNWSEQFDLEREKERMERYGVDFIHQLDPRYPEILRRLPDPPLGFYWRGSSIQTTPSVAVVGTRQSSSYGDKVARHLSAELVHNGFAVISGMARGIDTAAHWGAIDAGGTTFAVLGHGIEQVYPPENGELRNQIQENGGILSEFPFGRRPDRQTFPMRNRLITGLADALLVVETDVKGGSMITVRFAIDQTKPVFAVPGPLDQWQSRGCHILIREGATLVTSVQDILEELNMIGSFVLPEDSSGGLLAARPDQERNQPLLEGDSEVLWMHWRPGGCLTLDNMVSLTGWPVARVQSALLLLELKQLVRRSADGRYERI